MDIGCILWCLVCLLIIAMVACIAPWWFIPLIVGSAILYMVFDGGSLFKSHKSHKAKKSKHHHKNVNDDDLAAYDDYIASLDDDN